MKLVGAIALYVHAEDILRQPRFFEKIRRAFGGKPDLRTGRVRHSLEATAVTEGVRDALRRIGVTNAISLVIDDTVLFHDREGNADDLGDLFLAFHDNESVFGQGFRELRLAVEHREAGLHLVLEIQSRSEHPRDAPSVRILCSGRIEALTPKPGEDANAYRQRAEPIATDAKALETHRLQFAAFVDRVRDALASALPNARVEVELAEPRIVRPSEKPPEATRPDARSYDPYDHYYGYGYYGSPLGMAADMLMWSAMFSMMSPPHYVVVDSSNHFQGHSDDSGIQNGPTAEAPVDESSGWWDDPVDNDHARSAGADVDTDTSSDSNASDGGSWWDDSAGGDSGGDSFDGGDGGGFDFD